MSNHLFDAILNLSPNANFYVENGEVVWNSSDIEKPTDDQLELYETVADTAESNASVDSTRRNAYGSWNEQLDEIYHDIDAWKARIAKVKSDNPKG